MEKMGKKLTDRELIDHLVGWYKLDRSTEQLREAVSAYLQQNDEAEVVKKPDVGRNADFVSKPVAADFGAPKPASYTPQFEPTDELIGRRGWTIDAWALYYGIEDFITRISFGLVTMQTLAILFCVAISAAVMVGAWQSSLSTERQKKATFKSMVLDPAEKSRDVSPLEELTSPTNTDPTEPSTEQISTSTPDASASESVAADSTDVAKNKFAPSPSFQPPKFDPPGSELAPAFDLIADGAFDEAIANLQKLERTANSDLLPLLTLVKVEALIQKQDDDSLELARQLLLDCKCVGLDTVFDLLVARWILKSRPPARERFINEAPSLPEAVRQRMTLWAKISNGDKSPVTEFALKNSSSKGPTVVCDQLFIASLHFNLSKYDETLRELLDTQQKLLALESTGKNSDETRLFESAQSQLASKVEEIVSKIGKQRKEIN